MRLNLITLCVVVGLVMTAAFVPPIRARIVQRLKSDKSVNDRLLEFGPAARARMRPAFERAGLAYPPSRLLLVGLKAERRMHVYAAQPNGQCQWVCQYSILGASGAAGPKLREGDRQVPEGIYTIDSLNPNSLYHAAIRVAYPSDADRDAAKVDGRSIANLGGDIMIHGGSASIGCLAMGDECAEDLFTLAADTGLENSTIVIAPHDPRLKALPADSSLKPWLVARYKQVQTMIESLPAPR